MDVFDQIRCCLCFHPLYYPVEKNIDRIFVKSGSLMDLVTDNKVSDWVLLIIY